jgi:hypothetical protein
MDDTDEAVAVTGRPNDLPIVEHEPALANSTFGSRATGRGAEGKAVDGVQAENKAVTGAQTKRRPRRKPQE